MDRASPKVRFAIQRAIRQHKIASMALARRNPTCAIQLVMPKNRNVKIINASISIHIAHHNRAPKMRQSDAKTMQLGSLVSKANRAIAAFVYRKKSNPIASKDRAMAKRARAIKALGKIARLSNNASQASVCQKSIHAMPIRASKTTLRIIAMPTESPRNAKLAGNAEMGRASEQTTMPGASCGRSATSIPTVRLATASNR